MEQRCLHVYCQERVVVWVVQLAKVGFVAELQPYAAQDATLLSLCVHNWPWCAAGHGEGSQTEQHVASSFQVEEDAASSQDVS